MPNPLPPFDLRFSRCYFKARTKRDDGNIQRADAAVTAEVLGRTEMVTAQMTYDGTCTANCELQLRASDTGVMLMGLLNLWNTDFNFDRQTDVKGVELERCLQHESVMRAKLVNAITDYLLGKRFIGRDIRLLCPTIGIVEED